MFSLTTKERVHIESCLREGGWDKVSCMREGEETQNVVCEGGSWDKVSC